MTRWIKCKVTGTGKEGDGYRPEIFDRLTGTNWSAVYYPKNPPYQYCIVRMEAAEDKAVPIDKTKGEAELDEAGMKTECESNPYFKYRWLDQPEYPAVRTIKQVEEGR